MSETLQGALHLCPAPLYSAMHTSQMHNLLDEEKCYLQWTVGYSWCDSYHRNRKTGPYICPDAIRATPWGQVNSCH